MKKYKVLGAGPAGLCAAITLAKEGHEVEVVEQHKDVGTRFHGDLQGLENWTEKIDVVEELNQMGLESNFEISPHNKVHISDGRQMNEVIFSRPMYYLVKRGPMAGSLDQGLKDQALRAGVHISFGKRGKPKDMDIVATGPIPSKIFAVDKGIVFETAAEDISLALLDPKAAYKGYAYLLINKGYGCMCTVLFDRFNTLDASYIHAEKLISGLVDFDVQNPRKVGGVGGFTSHPILKENGILFAGEAAGIQDLAWGFGIRTALLSGQLAAKSLITGEDYEQMLMERLEDKIKGSLLTRALWELTPNRILIYLIKTMGNRENALEMMRSATRLQGWRRILYPPARWMMRRRYPKLDL